MAHTLRSLSATSAVKKVDGFRAHFESITIVDGFNIRIDDDELREHVAGIAGAIAAGQPIPAIEVWVNPESGVMECIDGHCRLNAYRLYSESHPEFDGWVSVTKFEGTPLQRKLRIESSNKQKHLKPIERGILYLEARDVLGATRQQIAEEVGMSLAHVDQHILLATGKPEVHQAIKSGEMSATDAVELVRKHGDQAPEELDRLREVAKQMGVEKITQKVIKKAAPAPEPKSSSKPQSKTNHSFVSACEVALVNSLSEELIADVRLNAPKKVTTIAVDPLLLLDLIDSVIEQREAEAAANDKQIELAVE